MARAEKKPETQQTPPADPPIPPPQSESDRSVPQPGAEFSLEWLVEQYAQQRPSYRDEASVYRWAEGGSWKHQAWAGEVQCSKLAGAEKEIASFANGGPGLYTVWLLSARDRQKVKGKYALVKVDADLRGAGAGGNGVDVVNPGGVAGIITAVAAISKREPDALTTRLVNDALDDRKAGFLAERSAYELGFNHGIERGKHMAGDTWKPRDVVDLVKEVTTLLRPGAAGAGDAGGNILDIFRTALDTGARPAQTLAFVQLFRGKGLILGLKQKLPEILAAAKQDPEALKLLEREGAGEWLIEFAAKVQEMPEG
jgi:hypothetical protein